jgi:hypothetical protein
MVVKNTTQNSDFSPIGHFNWQTRKFHSPKKGSLIAGEPNILRISQPEINNRLLTRKIGSMAELLYS